MAQCIGQWKSGENEPEFDEYLKDIGMGVIHRKMSRIITSYEDISQDGEEWVIHIHTAVRAGTYRYKAGVEIEETMLDGRKIRARLEVDGEKLVIYQNSVKEGVPNVKVIRERVDDNTLMMLIETDKRTVKRPYTKHEKKI